VRGVWVNTYRGSVDQNTTRKGVGKPPRESVDNTLALSSTNDINATWQLL